MASTRAMGRDGATLRVLGWDGSSLGDASLGGADPLGFAGGDTNLYRYVHNDPTDRTDPTGLSDVDKPRPVPPTEFPLPNPGNTFILGGPPVSDPNDPDNHRPPTAPKSYFCTTRGVPAGQFFPFESLNDFEKQVDRIRSIIAAKNMQDVYIVISGHSRPGTLFFGDGNGRQNTISTRPGDRDDLRRFLDALRSIYLDTSPTRTGAVYLEGCNSFNYDPKTPGNTYTPNDTQLGADLFAAINAALGGGVNLFGEVGYSAVFGGNFQIQGTSPGDGVMKYSPK